MALGSSMVIVRLFAVCYLLIAVKLGSINGRKFTRPIAGHQKLPASLAVVLRNLLWSWLSDASTLQPGKDRRHERHGKVSGPNERRRRSRI